MSLDDVSLYLSQQNIPGFPSFQGDVTNHIKSYTLKWDLFTGSAMFHCEFDRYFRITPGLPYFFRWTINNKKMMIGFIDKIQMNYSKNSLGYHLQGRDMTQILIENYIMFPKTYGQDPITSVGTPVNVKDLIQKIYDDNKSVSSISNLDGVGNEIETILPNPITHGAPIQFVYSPPANDFINNLPAVDTYRTNPGESIFDAIAKLINIHGLVMSNVPGTSNILIQRVQAPQSGNPVSFELDGSRSTDDPYTILNSTTAVNPLIADIVPANNVQSCDFTCDMSTYPKFIRAVGNAGSEETELATGGFGKKRIRLHIDKVESGSINAGYRGLTKLKSVVINRADAKAWLNPKIAPITGDVQNAIVNEELLAQNRQLLVFKYTVAGHSPDGINTYHVNHLASITDDTLNLHNYIGLVYQVEFSGSKESGMTTTMDICTPDSLDINVAMQMKGFNTQSALFRAIMTIKAKSAAQAQPQGVTTPSVPSDDIEIDEEDNTP